MSIFRKQMTANAGEDMGRKELFKSITNYFQFRYMRSMLQREFMAGTVNIVKRPW